MNRILLIATPLTAAFLVVFFCHTPSAGAQEAHQHQHEHSEKLGRVTFPVSCTPVTHATLADRYGNFDEGLSASSYSKNGAMRARLNCFRA